MAVRQITALALDALRGCVESARSYDLASRKAIDAACTVLGVDPESVDAEAVQDILLDWALDSDEPGDGEADALRALGVEIVPSTL